MTTSCASWGVIEDIIAYVAHGDSLRLLSPLVFTAAAFGISLFQRPERQYQSFKKVQVSKFLKGLGSHPQNPQLDDSFVSLVRLSLLRSSKNNEPFSSSFRPTEFLSFWS